MYSFCNYSMHINNLKIIKANITQILKKEISRINIPQVDKRKIWKAYHEKKNQKHFVNKNSKTSNEQKANFQKFNCSLWRNNWTSWTSKKFMSPLCLLNFLHVVQIVNLKDATQPLPKLQWGSSVGQYWGHQCPWISNGNQVHHVCKMGKGRDWNKYSYASSLVTWLLQIVNNAKALLLIQSGCLFQGDNMAITLVSFWWPFGCSLW